MGTTADFTTSFLHFLQFSAFHSSTFHSRPVHSHMFTHIHTQRHTYTHKVVGAFRSSIFHSRPIHSYMFTHRHTQTHTYTHTNTHIHTQTHTHTVVPYLPLLQLHTKANFVNNMTHIRISGLLPCGVGGDMEVPWHLGQ